MKTVAVSGGFDPVHVGHVRLFQEAAKIGDKLVLILNNDNWLRQKKGFVFMPENERAEVLKALRVVDDVLITKHEEGCEDMSVCDALSELKPHVFANGGDRKADNIPEYALCDKLGIVMKFNVGGGKVQSSSELAKNSLEAGRKV